jgi:hypothetical protein
MLLAGISVLLGLFSVHTLANPSHAAASVSSVYTFPLGTWIENLAVRSNGLILASSASAPQIWQVDPDKPDRANLIATLPNHLASSGVTEVEPDIFYVGANNFSLNPPSVKPNASAVYRLDLSTYDQSAPITPIIVADFPVSGLLNGFITLSKEYILIADAGLGLIWRLNIHTSDKVAILSDPLMGIVDAEKEPIGVNGLKIHNGHLYFSNTNQELLARIPITGTGERAGPTEIVAHYAAPDDFVFAPGRREAVLVAGNDTLRIIVDGEVKKVADSPLLAGSTAVALGRNEHRRGKGKKIYVSTSGGVEQYVKGAVIVPGRVVEIKWW